MLVGVAIGEGLIGSVDQSLAELLPAYVPIMRRELVRSRFVSC